MHEFPHPEASQDRGGSKPRDDARADTPALPAKDVSLRVREDEAIVATVGLSVYAIVA